MRMSRRRIARALTVSKMQTYTPRVPGPFAAPPRRIFMRKLRMKWRRAGEPVVLLAIAVFALAGSALAQEPPKYQVDASWPRELPNNWIMGQVGGMAVDRQDHIWVLQRPGTDTPDELGESLTPPRSQCCLPTPSVLEFDTQGNLLQSWGGPGEGF